MPSRRYIAFHLPKACQKVSKYCQAINSPAQIEPFPVLSFIKHAGYTASSGDWSSVDDALEVFLFAIVKAGVYFWMVVTGCFGALALSYQICMSAAVC